MEGIQRSGCTCMVLLLGSTIAGMKALCFVQPPISLLSNGISGKAVSFCRSTFLSASRMPPLDDYSKKGNDDENMLGEGGNSELDAKASRSKQDVHIIRRNLELRWKLMSSNDECDLEDIHTCGGMCDLCDGEGLVECRFCGGTGFFTVGDELVGKGQGCPVCSGVGEEECKGCMGSGFVARWQKEKDLFV